MFIPFDYIVVEAIHYGMSSHMAWSLVPILNGASFFGRTVPNYIADKVGRFNVMLVMTTLSAILVLALWLPARDNGALITFAALFGITSGAIIGLGPVLIIQISPMSELGYRVGTVLAFAAVGTLTSPPIGGAIAASDEGSYIYTCVFSGVSFLLGTVGLAALCVRLSGWGLTTKIEMTGVILGLEWRNWEQTAGHAGGVGGKETKTCREDKTWKIIFPLF